MKKNLLKNVGIIALAVVICMLPQICTMAAVIHTGAIASFVKQYVDSNEWTYVCYTKDTVKSTEVSIRVTDIYTASGGESWYSKVNVSTCFENTLLNKTNLTLDKTVYFTIPTEYRAAGNYYRLFAMGNNPALDCQITGDFVAH